MPGSAACLLLAICGAALLSGVWCDAARCEIVFSSEQINVFVRMSGMRVEGSYTFANPDTTLCQQWLFYPFPVDSLHPTVDKIEIRSSGVDVPFHSKANGVFFCVSLPKRGSVVVDVCYEQTCLDSSGCYILTSTARWDSPLEHASFEVHVPDSLLLDWMAYDAEPVTTSIGETIYRFARNDFMPDADLCLRWRGKRD
jgi:hypothetical protein